MMLRCPICQQPIAGPEIRTQIGVSYHPDCLLAQRRQEREAREAERAELARGRQRKESIA